jgi:nucleotide-binding universal stress UspA family protein
MHFGRGMSALPSSTSRPFLIVVAVDLTDTDSSGFAFDQAARMTIRIRDSQLHVVNVLPDSPTKRGQAHECAALLRLYVEEKARALGDMTDQTLGIHVRMGDAATQIAQLGADLGADVIVVGSHHAPRLKNLVLGSTAERVMAHATCPIFVAGPRPKVEPSHVIVIEGPCPDCLSTRMATSGKQWWCERHSERHNLRRHHVYSYHSDFPFAEHDSEVSPTGAD